MFDETSRYGQLEVKAHVTDTGDEVRYVARRFLPDQATVPEMATVRVTEGVRLDLLAHRHLGDATQFWRIADANNAMNPDDLLSPLGRRLRIPAPAGGLPQIKAP